MSTHILRAVFLVVSFATADRLQAQGPPFEQSTTPEQQKQMKQIQQAGGEISHQRGLLSTAPGARPEDIFFATISVEENQTPRQLLAAIGPLLKNLDGRLSLEIEGVDWTEEDIRSLKEVQELKNLVSLSITHRNLSPREEEQIQKMFPQVESEQMKFTKLTHVGVARKRSISPATSEIQKLIIQRYNIAVEKMRGDQKVANRGRSLSPFVLHFSRADVVLQALDLCEAPAEKIVWLERMLAEFPPDDSQYRPEFREDVLRLRLLQIDFKSMLIRARQQGEERP